ncbi:MAG TPA: hypothetical protein VG096_13370 [Bryobacteraceae bacterium]|jgi:hypothetical protein|nr:hypothetical protein [Bryobacteraceae bacterium]
MSSVVVTGQGIFSIPNKTTAARSSCAKWNSSVAGKISTFLDQALLNDVERSAGLNGISDHFGIHIPVCPEGDGKAMRLIRPYVRDEIDSERGTPNTPG